jgi:hypothetical protein
MLSINSDYTIMNFMHIHDTINIHNVDNTLMYGISTLEQALDDIFSLCSYNNYEINDLKLRYKICCKQYNQDIFICSFNMCKLQNEDPLRSRNFCPEIDHPMTTAMKLHKKKICEIISAVVPLYIQNKLIHHNHTCSNYP